MSGSLRRLRAVPPAAWLEAFVLANLAFLALDIFVAHSANHFARAEEWLPIAFSIVAPLALAPALFGVGWRERMQRVALLIGGLSVLIGVAGMVFHLQSAFFAQQTLQRLVYSAPFVAPLSYVGVGLLLLLNHVQEAESLEWSRWVLVLALGGFMGNFLLSLLDHAQNGFFSPWEWVPVGAAAFGSSFLLLLVCTPFDWRLRQANLVIVLLEAGVGVIGCALHVLANLRAPGGATWRDRFVYGAPAFAPLLFADLALLAGLGLWGLSKWAPLPKPAPTSKQP